MSRRPGPFYCGEEAEAALAHVSKIMSEAADDMEAKVKEADRRRVPAHRRGPGAFYAPAA